MSLTDAEREAIDNAAPVVADDTEGWEWHVLYKAVERIVAARMAGAWDEGWEHYSKHPFPQAETFGKRHNPYRGAAA